MSDNSVFNNSKDEEKNKSMEAFIEMDRVNREKSSSAGSAKSADAKESNNPLKFLLELMKSIMGMGKDTFKGTLYEVSFAAHNVKELKEEALEDGNLLEAFTYEIQEETMKKIVEEMQKGNRANDAIEIVTKMNEEINQKAKELINSPKYSALKEDYMAQDPENIKKVGAEINRNLQSSIPDVLGNNKARIGNALMSNFATAIAYVKDPVNGPGDNLGQENATDLSPEKAISGLLSEVQNDLSEEIDKNLADGKTYSATAAQFIKNTLEAKLGNYRIEELGNENYKPGMKEIMEYAVENNMSGKETYSSLEKDVEAEKSKESTDSRLMMRGELESYAQMVIDKINASNIPDEYKTELEAHVNDSVDAIEPADVTGNPESFVYDQISFDVDKEIEKAEDYGPSY